MMWTMSAPSKRSRKLTNSFEAISSSAASTRVWHAQYQARGTAIDPRLVDCDHGIAHAGDQVDEVSVAMRLGQPHRVANFGLKALLLQMSQRLGHGLAGQEEVKIFSVAPDAGVLLQRECAGNHVGNARVGSGAPGLRRTSARCSGGNSGGTEVLTGNSFSVATA